MNKSQNLSKASELMAQSTSVSQLNTGYLPSDCRATTLCGKEDLANLTSGMAQAIQESIEMSFGK